MCTCLASGSRELPPLPPQILYPALILTALVSGVPGEHSPVKRANARHREFLPTAPGHLPLLAPSIPEGPGAQAMAVNRRSTKLDQNCGTLSKVMLSAA